MRAITYSRYGGADVLELTELPTPKVGPDSVLVRVRAASVNPVDWKVRAGYLDAIMDVDVPGGARAGTSPASSSASAWTPRSCRSATRSTGTSAATGCRAARSPSRRGARPDPRAQARVAVLRGGRGRAAGRADGVPGDPAGRRAATGRPSSCTPRPAASARSPCRSPGRSAPASSAPRRSATTSTCAASAPSRSTYGDGLVERVRALAPDGVDVVLDFGGDDLVETSKALLADGGTVASIVDAAARDELGGHYVWVRPTPPTSTPSPA